MRSFKKVLTLALVFAMAIGLLTAGALNFTDADDIQYKTAVEVMTNLGAINGYTDGTFRPDGLVTRAEAAKLVTYAILTPKVAEMLPKGTSSFTDVPATHWAAPYIEYCVSQGIINGKGAGKFDPNGNVTGLELAKMLLVAAGYGRNNEYVGSNWALNVAIDAIDHNIFEGSKQTNYSVPATREEAALYVFNALTKVDKVKFNTTTNSYELTVAGGETIGEQKYNLTESTPSVNGVTGSMWLSNGVPVSSFVPTEKVLGTSMNGTTITALTDKYDPTRFVAELDTGTIRYFLNGSAVTTQYATGTAYAENTLFIHKKELYRVTSTITDEDNTGFANITAKVAPVIVKGVIVNLVDDNPVNGKVDKISIIEKKVHTLSADPVVSRGTVDISGITPSAVDAKYVPGYENLKKDDVVLWYLDSTGTYNIEKATALTGTVTAIAGTKYYIDGVAYEKSQLNGTTSSAPTLLDLNKTYYLDNAGYIVEITGPEVDPPQEKYALVLDYLHTPASTINGTVESSKAQLLLEDGTVGVFDLVTNSGKVQNDHLETAPGLGGLIKYVMNDNGVITSITKLSKTEVDNGVEITNKAATADIDGTAAYVRATTVFFFYGGDPVQYGVVRGFNNVPDTTLDGGDYFIDIESDVLNAIVIPTAPTAVPGDKAYAYVTNAVPTLTLEVINGVPTTVYTYEAYVDGVATTIKTLDNGSIDVGVYEIVETNGYYALTPPTSVESDKTVTILESTYFVADSQLYNLGSTTEVYKATKNGNGDIVKLEAAELTAAPVGKSLKVNVVYSGSSPRTALYVIFWHE